MREITTRQGDTWDIVAWREYGDEHEMATLIDANPRERQRVVFPAGVMLKVPDVPTQDTAPLPPWRRG